MTIVEWLKEIARFTVYSSTMTKLCEDLPVMRRFYRGWYRTHPFDLKNGTDTSGFVSVRSMHIRRTGQGRIYPYGPSQPSTVRGAISALGPVDQYTFVDLGCGKGRVLLVAMEFAFREVIGVELSARLAEIARKNITKVERMRLGGTAARLVEGSVLDFPLPDGKLIIYNFHALNTEILKGFIVRLEESIGVKTPHVFFVYSNPVHFECIDTSSSFQRFFANNIHCDKSEIDCGSSEQLVVIWQSRHEAIPTPHKQVDRKIVSDGITMSYLES